MRIINEAAFVARPTAVLFDLDHTLYDHDRAHAGGMRATRERVKSALNVSAAGFDAAFGTSRAATKARLGATAASHSRLLYFTAMLEQLGFGPQPLLALDLEQTYWRAFLRGAVLVPGAMDLLTELRAHGIPLGLVTDLTAQIQFRKLVYFGIDRLFDAVVTSEEAGTDKSGHVPFHLALSKLGVAAGSPVWMIGDSQADIGGAKAALGATTIQKLWSVAGLRILRDADAVIHDIGPCVSWVQRRFA